MVLNDALPDIEIDPERYTVTIDGERIAPTAGRDTAAGAALFPVLGGLGIGDWGLGTTDFAVRGSGVRGSGFGVPGFGTGDRGLVNGVALAAGSWKPSPMFSLKLKAES